jgi:prepilin-type N-terminal cleavage/methylation domain-containing protein
MSNTLATRAPRFVPRARQGLSLIEVLVAVIVLSIMMTYVGHISASLTQSQRRNDLIAKRTFAMQQTTNIVGALPFKSLTTTVLPASKTMTLGDFSYIRRIAITTSGSATAGQTATISITIVPQTNIIRDTLLKDSLQMYRSAPICGTALGIVAC